MALSKAIKSRPAVRRSEEGDRGFTLVELMVVVLVIAILLAIAIPTFLGARERSQDRAAQSNLRNALTAAKVAFSNDGDYASATAATGHLDVIEPRLEYVDGAAATPVASDAENEVSVYVNAGSCSYPYPEDNGSQSDCVRTGTTTSWNASMTPKCTAANLGHRLTEAHCEAAGTWSTTGGKSNIWAGAVWSESENCFFIRDDSEATGNTAGTYYGSSPTTACTGTSAASTSNVPDKDW